MNQAQIWVLGIQQGTKEHITSLKGLAFLRGRNGATNRWEKKYIIKKSNTSGAKV